MRNLKKLLAVILTVVMIASMMVPALAANTYEDEALKLQAINVFAGGPEDLKLDEGVTRIQGLTFAIRAAGKDAEALAMEDAEVDAILADWTDADSIPAWGRKYAAYAIKNSITVGLSSTEKIFGALNPISGTSFLVFVMKSGMGYADVTTANVIDAAVNAGILTAGQAATFGAKEALIRDDAAGILFGAFTTGVNADGTSLLDAYIASGATTAADAAAAGFVSSAALAVESIAATSAKTFTVKFNKAVTDDDKVTFSVKRLSSAVTVTTTWNEAKTEATLTGASNFAESTFTVAVLKDGVEIASENITITAQRVGKIEFTSDTVAVTVADKTGYVTFRVYDQYGNDITNTSMGNSLTAQVGVDTTTASGASLTIKNGLMTIKGATPDLITVQSLSVVLYDSSVGVTATASLPISTAVGTLSNFVLGSTENLKLVEGDTTSVFYLPYVATDMAGNETKDYALVSGGLIDADQGTDEVDLVVSLNNKVSAKVVKDPSNSKVAAIEVKYIGASSDLVMDMPITITAMTYGGKTSVVDATLVKSKAVESLILLAPAETVAVGERPEIPFEAYDQNGNRITSYSDISAGVKPVNEGFEIVEKADGSAKFVMKATTGKGMVSLSATLTKSGKISNILNINVQDKAKPASIIFATNDFVAAMEQKAVQAIKIGNGGKDNVTVYDQYDRKISNDDLKTFLTTDYAIKLTVTGNVTTNAITVSNTLAPINVTAADIGGGSGKIEFVLEKLGDKKELDSASTGITVIATKDISNYTVNTADTAIYTAVDRATTAGAITAQKGEYSFNAKVYGTTSAGTKVLLADKPIVAASVSNGDDFLVTSITTDSAFNAVKVTAKGLDNNRSEASTDLIITVAHNNVVKPLKVAIKSSTTGPVANDIKLEGFDGDGLVKASNGTYKIQKYDSNGAKTGSPFYFFIKDSYGKEGMRFASFKIAKVFVKSKDETVAGNAYDDASITNDGELTLKDTADTGDVVYITAITNNGLSATVKVEIQ